MAATTGNRSTGASRRTALGIGAAAGAAVLGGCTVYGRDPDPPRPPPPEETGDGATGGEPTADGDPQPDAAEAEQAEAGGTPVASTGDVPVGGGLIDADHGVVITQPTADEFRAFSSTCTHQGCTVSDVSDETIICGCHDSRFSTRDGSVVQAAQGSGLTPETQDPLLEVGIVVDGDTIALPR